MQYSTFIPTHASYAHHQLVSQKQILLTYKVERKKESAARKKPCGGSKLDIFFSAFAATMHRPPQNDHSTYASETL